MRIVKILTDIGRPFTDSFKAKGKRPTGPHVFDRTCAEFAVKLGLQSHSNAASHRPMTTPKVTQLEVTPVAGRDSMLLNLSGAHGPFFTRNIVVLTDSAGHTGVGEVPASERIRQTIDDARDLLVGQPIGNYLVAHELRHVYQSHRAFPRQIIRNQIQSLRRSPEFRMLLPSIFSPEEIDAELFAFRPVVQELGLKQLETALAVSPLPRCPHVEYISFLKTLDVLCPP